MAHMMPVALRYSGAHTHRLSGDWRLNMQNLPRDSNLRRALIAPPGHTVVAGDLAQIEARLTAWLAGTPMLETFRAGKDPYAEMASNIFNRPITKADTVERFIGKTAVLGLGYGMGKDKFYVTVLRTARAQNIDVTKLKQVWTPELAGKSVQAYRRVNRSVVELWYKLDTVLATAWSGFGEPVHLGPLTIGHGYVRGPNGLEMRYVVPEGSQGRSYLYAKVPHTMWGGSMLENCCQYLARVIIMNAAVRMSNLGYNMALQAHDELVYVVRSDDVDNVKALLYEELVRPPSWALDLPLGASISSPSWALDLPLGASISSGQSYGDC